MKLLNKLLFPLTLALALSIFGIWARMPQQTLSNAPVGVELPIVMYHHILKEECRLNAYTISPEEFRQDMQFLKNNGYTPINFQDLVDFCNGKSELPTRPVMITFDDGYESFHEYAYPILKEYGFKSVFSVVGYYADQYTKVDDHHIRYSHCTWNQLRLLHDSGLVEIQNHSYNLHSNDKGRHGSMKKSGENPALYQQMLAEDLEKMQAACAENLRGYRPLAFTYPFGQISPESIPVIKQMGFLGAFTCRERLNYIEGDPEELYALFRFNRPHGTSFESILKNAS